MQTVYSWIYFKRMLQTQYSSSFYSGRVWVHCHIIKRLKIVLQNASVDSILYLLLCQYLDAPKWPSMCYYETIYNNNSMWIYKAHNVNTRLNLRRRQSLGGDDWAVKWKAKGTETIYSHMFAVRHDLGQLHVMFAFYFTIPYFYLIVRQVESHVLSDYNCP